MLGLGCCCMVHPVPPDLAGSARACMVDDSALLKLWILGLHWFLYFYIGIISSCGRYSGR